MGQALDIEIESTESSQKDRFDDWSLRAIAVITLVGALIIVAYGFQIAATRALISCVALSLAVAGAAFLGGGLTGFLFGIPRRRQREDSSAVEDTTESNGKQRQSVYTGNTNLEQISDWLTKILVGVGLTQVPAILDAIDKAGDVVATGFGVYVVGGKPFAIAIILYFSVAGFLVGYLWTSLYLGRALTQAERTYSLRKQLSQREARDAADARALSIVGKQLSLEESEKPSEKELESTIKAASHETRAHVFYRAQGLHERSWREEVSKPAVELTIPVFRALTRSDERKEYHENFGFLGFALKNQRNPDWQAAEKALSEAIAIRKFTGDSGYISYEANRAICRIMQDPSFAKKEPSTTEQRDRILADLEVAGEDDWVSMWVTKDALIVEWLRINKLRFPGKGKNGD